MMTKKVYTVTDLGFGDGGKGGVIHKLVTYAKPHTILKVGGAQGSHGVTYSDGKVFHFSQFGCGTREKVRTHLAHTFVASAVGLIHEAEGIESELGVSNPFDLLTADPRVLISTSFHGIASRLKEIARGKNARGIIGVGIGEALIDAEMYPELAIYARDLASPRLKEKLRAVLEMKRAEIARLYEYPFMHDEADAGLIKEQLDHLRDDDFYRFVCETFDSLARKIKVVDEDYLRREIFSRDGNIITESSHGVLTDRLYGFHPHTSRLRTVPAFQAEQVLKDGGWQGDVVRLGVTRAYQIKHGPGPFVVDVKDMLKLLLPEEVGVSDRYNGSVRVGPLDLVAMRYARDVLGEDAKLDALCVTWCDAIERLGRFDVCDKYEGFIPEDLFTDNRNIKVSHESGLNQANRQRRLAEALLAIRPIVSSYCLPAIAQVADVRSLVANVVLEAVGIPVRMIGMGPTDKDKILF